MQLDCGTQANRRERTYNLVEMPSSDGESATGRKSIRNIHVLQNTYKAICGQFVYHNGLEGFEDFKRCPVE